ncbi:MAG TPA: elongation factor P [candidate division Zixibacteria bacterium]|nr:elongation factor P [candidate division Zixibacteria bacterium]HEQ98195.1 elongation factor P [candidate division Zixibacteria bacterium]
MIDTSDFFKGMKIEIEGEPFIILDFQNARTAQRRANVTTKLKHLVTGQVLEKTFSSGTKFEEPPFETRDMQYMYNDGESYHFMDTDTYDQIAIPVDAIGDDKWYLLENHTYEILFYRGNAININLPTSVVLEVVEAEPAIKGDRVSNVMKGAKVETGLEVKVPIFVKEGDKIKIDTRDGKYLERM